MKIILSKYILLISFFIFLLLSFSYSEVGGKNNYQLIADPDFNGAVKIIIKEYYHEGDAALADAIKNIIQQFCYVENNQIKCK